MLQILHPYMTTGKIIVLTIWTFVRKVMSLLFNMLSRLVIAFLPRSKHLLISWLQSPFAVILEPPKIKSDTVSIVSPFLFAMMWWQWSSFFECWALSQLFHCPLSLKTVSDFIFLGSKITVDGDCSHEIKRHLLLGRKVMANLDSIFKSRDIANKGPHHFGRWARKARVIRS